MDVTMRQLCWRPRLLVLFACCASLLPASRSARGVVAAKSKLSTFYAQSRFVATGKVAAANGNVVDVNSVEVLKGVPPKVAGMKVKVEQPADLAGRLKAGDAVVVFDQEALCLVHAGDTWLVAKAAARGPNPAFVAQGPHPERELFPGRTAGLAAAVAEIKAGKSTLLNEFHQDIFSGGVKEVGKTLPNASFAVAADVNG